MTLKLSDLIGTNEAFLSFLKTRASLYHQSNVFFRDFHYGVIAFGDSKGIKVRYDKAEALAHELVASFVRAGILRPISPGTWMLNYPGYKKPSTKPEVASKPGSPASRAAVAAPSSGSSSAAPPAPTNA
jgi:hypothetical protein